MRTLLSRRMLCGLETLQARARSPQVSHVQQTNNRILSNILDLGAVGEDHDDGCSLSSVESGVIGDEEEEEEEKEETNEDDVAPPENDTVDVICIDDDDDEQDTPAVSSSDKVESVEGTHNKYRKMAKKLKVRVKMLESERQRLSQTQKAASERHEKLERERRVAAENTDIFKTKYATSQRQVESFSLDITRIRRERDQAALELQAVENRAQSLTTKMVELRKQYTQDVERAHANSMAEVQTILNEHPKLTEANRRLRERIQRLEARFLGGSLHKNNNTNNTKTVDREQMEPQDRSKSAHRASKNTAKLLRDFEGHQDDAAEKLFALADVKIRMKGNFPNAARFSRASEKPAARLPTAVSALDAIDQQPQYPLEAAFALTQKHKRQSLEQARKFLNAPPRKRSKILPAVPARDSSRPFASKRPQNDIRNMLPRR
jgi:chromosome segregation ATPase